MATDDFFRARLDSMIDMRHPLAVLATRMPWAQIEASLAPLLAHKDRDGRLVQDADLFGPTAHLAGGGLSNACQHRLTFPQFRRSKFPHPVAVPVLSRG